MSVLLSLFYFFYFAIIGVYVIFLPKVLTIVGYSASDIGIIFAAGPLVRFMLPFAFTKGLKLSVKVFNAALAFMLFSSISFYFSINNFYALLLSNICLGIGLSLVLPYIEVISLRTIGKEKYGKIRLFGSVGFILVALILVKFLSGAEVAFLYLIILTLFTVAVAFVIVRNSDENKEKIDQTTNDINLINEYKLWVGLILMQISFGAFYNFFTIYETDYGISLDMTIYLWSFAVLAEILMLFFQGNLLKGNLLLILQVTTFVTAIRWFLLFLFPQNMSILFFSQSLHAFSFALFHTAAISYLYNFYKNKSLTQQFFSGIVYGLGGFIGALYAGYIYELFPKYLFLSATFIALMASWFLYLWSKQMSVNNQ